MSHCRIRLTVPTSSNVAAASSARPPALSACRIACGIARARAASGNQSSTPPGASVRTLPRAGRPRRRSRAGGGGGPGRRQHVPPVARRRRRPCGGWPAVLAAHLHVRRLAGGAELEQLQRALAGGRPPMDELEPREVVQVAVLAGHEEAGRHHGGGLPALRAVGVDVARLVGPVRVAFQRRTGRCPAGPAGGTRGRPSSGGTGRPGCRPAPPRRTGRQGCFPLGRRAARAAPAPAGPVCRAPRPAAAPRRSPRDRRVALPVLQAHDHHRQVGQVDDRPDAEGGDRPGWVAARRPSGNLSGRAALITASSSCWRRAALAKEPCGALVRSMP